MPDTPPNTAPSTLLLNWYDIHARVLPWRSPPNQNARPDPYRVWLSEVMLQQTTVVVVRAYYLRFTTLWPTVTDLANAPDAQVMAEWAGLGYYARARNLLACARRVAHAHGGQFPPTLAGLRALPGIGPYTAAAIASIAFDAFECVVDGNVERVMARIFDEHMPLPQAKAVLTRHAATLTPKHRPGDYAQAVMDLGATICTPRNPDCPRCPWQNLCRAHAAGTHRVLPRKSAKPAKPTRTGTIWIARNRGQALLVERRPDRGLLGGTLGFPTTGWDGSELGAPLQADWRSAGQIRHSFTHFHLDLTVLCTTCDAAPSRGYFLTSDQITATDLPSLMRKAHSVALSAFSTV